jgi:hypothetical protein
MQKCDRLMHCDHFEEFIECDANAKIDSHYQPCSIAYGGRNWTDQLSAFASSATL